MLQIERRIAKGVAAVATFDQNIFRAYDIRGNTQSSLTPSVAKLVGLAFGSYLKKFNEHTAVVGRDNRYSSPELQKALCDGILATGSNVIDIGQVITPVFYYAQKLFGIGSGVMVTGSHNPPEDNGFKITVGGNTLFEEQIQELKNIILKNQYLLEDRGKYELRPVTDTYVNMLQKKITLGKRKIKIVVDAGNGTASDFAPPLLEALGCQVIPLYCHPDPSFPHHHPDPVDPKNLVDLQQKVLAEKADLGIAYDGDGDRIGVVDDQGNILWGDQLMILYWREILPRYPGSTALVEVKCSQALIDEIVRLGGKPVFSRTGHSLIKNLMKKTGSIFTGEMSGHMFFADEYYGYDDALYATLRLLRILSQTSLPLSQLLQDIPQYYATPETRVPCPDEVKFNLVDEIKKELSPRYPVITVDGVRVQFPYGWGLVRASNTQPVLVLRCEAISPEKLLVVKQFFSTLLLKKLQIEHIYW